MRQSDAPGYLRSKLPKKITKWVEIWLSMARSIAAESEQLFDLVRRATLSQDEQCYILQRKARYPEARAQDIRYCQADLQHSTAWVLSRNEAARRLPLDLPYSPTSPDVEDSKDIGSSHNELFGSDS